MFQRRITPGLEIIENIKGVQFMTSVKENTGLLLSIFNYLCVIRRALELGHAEKFSQKK